MFAKKVRYGQIRPAQTGGSANAAAAQESGSESAGAITENTMATMLLAQGGIDSAVGGTTAGSSIDDTVVAAADKADSGAPGAASARADRGQRRRGRQCRRIHRWHHRRPVVFATPVDRAHRNRGATERAAIKRRRICNRASTSDPAHVMLVNQHHHTASHLTGRARAHDAYGSAAS